MAGKSPRRPRGGLDVRTEAKVVRWPARFSDGGEPMWRRVVALLDQVEAAP